MYKVRERTVQLVETFFFFLPLPSQKKTKTRVKNKYHMIGEFETSLELMTSVITNVIGFSCEYRIPVCPCLKVLFKFFKFIHVIRVNLLHP